MAAPLPNPRSKRNRRWAGASPHPYFTREAAALLRDQSVQHVLVDVPSLDRADDGGRMIAHRTFWELASTGHATTPPALGRTITELIYVPDAVADGPGLLNLQVSPLGNDAVPSRPVFMPLVEGAP